MKGWMGKFKVLSLLGFVALFLSACGKENLTALDPKGYGAEKSLDLIILPTVIMSFVFLVVMVIFTIALVRFRKRKGREDFIPKQVEGNKTLETVWTIIPILLIIIIAVPTVWYTFVLADKADAKDHINIGVTGNQYWWHFNYDGMDIQTSQDLYIPVGEKVYLNMLSSDVIHSFWVPTLSGKLDVNPENENTFYIEAYEEGVYWGKCAELCGPSHSLMDFKIVAVSKTEFEQWVADMQSVDPEAVPDNEMAAQGRELFQENNCIGCHAIGSSPVAVGPNLTDFGNRTKLAGVKDMTKENIVAWLLNPEKIKPGNKMTGAYPKLSEEDASLIAEYLMQLKPSEITTEDAGK
ncbi:cytochrome c oxidase subunit II [Ornithinibacillus bavariensis]|uniref:Cytochrome c oxidase subunit 2 n=1 Tax=Ornithinibacillus bavariensis TaxID=545502 RepID=A0A919X7T5_9BACI|nr:cytochrome c oxidase subunit II [Ornithinibacillus bavariensis]GIO26032.1 cytochrome c oxidase subunit 2 [Ornithinibacillus bavariensis]HAM82124.1 cytochrome c oxidase subunit II [Ornithinibacillus sp.]